MNQINPFNDEWSKSTLSYHRQQPPAKKPKPLTFQDLFPNLDRWGIGVSDTLGAFQRIAETKPSYPPYNIIRDKALGGRWEIDLAVAGFRKSDLQVFVQENTLTVRTNPDVDFGGDDIREVIHQGIAQRNFELKFALADHIELQTASMSDGILRIVLSQELPEEKQPKYIEIE